MLKTPLSFGALVSWPQPQVLKTGAMAAIYQQHAAVLEQYVEPVRSQYSGLHGTE